MSRSITFFFVSIFVLSSLSSFGQENYNWEEPVCFTDSNSNNRNVIYSRVNFTYEYGKYFFWEQFVDDSTTWIYYKNFYHENDQDTLFYDLGVHYHNVNIIPIQYNSDEESFVILYESDKSGIYSIYFRIFNYTNQQFSAEQKLTDSESDQHFLISNDFGRVMWIEDNMVYHAMFDKYSLDFVDPVVLDSGDCSYPSVTRFDYYELPQYENKVAWVKEINGESNIMISEYDNVGGWSEPEVIYTSDSITNFSAAFGNDQEFTLCWDNYTGSDWEVIIYDENYSGFETIIEDGDLPFSPSYFSGWHTSKSDLFSGFLTLIQSESPYVSNVYTSPVYYYSLSSLVNVSLSNSQVRNPHVRQIGSEGVYFFFYNIWEELIEGKWQIMTSKNYAYISDIEDNEVFSSAIYPNPTTNYAKLCISKNKESLYNIHVYNMRGELVKKLFINSKNPEIILDCSNFEPGTYTIKLLGQNKAQVKKLIVL